MVSPRPESRSWGACRSRRRLTPTTAAISRPRRRAPAITSATAPRRSPRRRKATRRRRGWGHETGRLKGAGMAANVASGYTLTARILHWLTAALVLTMIPIGIVMANANFGVWQDTLYD